MIVLDKVSLKQAQFELRDASLEIPSGSYGILMGRTGAGKTSLLECVVGFRRIISGRILLNGEDVTNRNPAVRGIGYVPQDGALFSRMKVRDQIGFALQVRGVGKKQRIRRVDELAELLGIPHLLKRFPTRLSGGERQRVALGRALSFAPSILCLDEPLSALDSETRSQMCELLRTVQQTTGVTTMHITHNEAEAMKLADVTFRIVDGRIETSEPSSAT